MKRWFITVDWCSMGNRGVFCDAQGGAFAQDEQHTDDEMGSILGVFEFILHPQSILLSEEELKAYHFFVPLSEYSGVYGVALKEQVPA